MFNNTFYPTPETLANKMLMGIDFTFIQTVLEPSAGKGDLITAVQKANDRNKYSYNHHSIDIDAVELDPNLRALLKGNEIRVVHDNFLTMHTSKHYDLIIMNPPFSEGDKHLLKALEMQQNGGQVVCLLNAETIRNPYSNTRKDLVRKLKEYDASIEYVQNAFRKEKPMLRLPLSRSRFLKRNRNPKFCKTCARRVSSQRKKPKAASAGLWSMTSSKRLCSPTSLN